MNECGDLVIQFFLRAISGAVALVLGTGLCYFLFIGRYLRQLELYKERLRIYKDLDKRAASLIQFMNSLRRSPLSFDSFTESLYEFNEYSVGEDRLFVSGEVKTKCRNIMKTQEERSYLYQPDELPYVGEELRNLENEFQSLRELIESEIASAHAGIPVNLNNWVSRVKQRFHDPPKQGSK